MPKVKKIYMRQNGVQKQIYPATWNPWSNTIAYYPLNWDVNDYSGNNRNLTAYNVTYDTLTNGEQVAYFNWSNAYAILTGLSLRISKWTQNVWIKKSRNNSGECFTQVWATGTNDWGWRTYTYTTSTWAIWHNLYYNSSIFQWYNNTWIANWTWMNVVTVVSNTWNKFYVNWQQVTLTYSKWNTSTWFWTRTFNTLVLSRHPWASADRCQWDISRWIIEDRAWTDAEILSYYNLTKWNYWL